MSSSALNGRPNGEMSSICEFPQLLDGDDARTTNKKEYIILELPKNLAAFLQNFSDQEGKPLDSVIQGIWALILKAFTGDNAACFKSSISCEERAVKWEIIHICVESDATFLDLLNSIRNQAESGGISSVDGRIPCNTSICLVEDFCQQDAVEDEAKVSLLVTRENEQWALSLRYDTSHLSPAYAEVVSSTFDHILTEALKYPSRKLSDMKLVSSHILNQMKAWTDGCPTSETQCVGQLFERTVKERPSFPAIQTSALTLTYCDLDNLSMRLALHLQAGGVRPEQAVLLCFPKSAWAVVAMMAVVRAGGVILFLDPSHPRARHDEIQDRVKARWVLTAPEYADRWSWTDVKVLSIDRTFVESLLLPVDSVISEVMPSNALYIIFTSGSTGKPKGCVVEHRQFLTGSLAQQKASQMNYTDKVLQLASFTFDVSILEILTSLISGSCVCIPNDDERSKGPAYCIQYFGITWAFLTPSLVKLMSPEMVPTLKFLVLGGEAVQRENIQTWASHVCLANGYGPTECSIAATANPRLSTSTDPANIGFPLGGCCWIVDKENHDRLLPIGAPGELIIQGAIVARGYFNDAEKTQAVFLEDAEWMSPEFKGLYRRLYKTGDLARMNTDGSIHFIGRKDNQIKLRGLRIELGEVEHRLAADPLVQQVVVRLGKRERCQGKLVAVISLKAFYQVSQTIELPDKDRISVAITQLADVSARLSRQLPEYMQPTVWVPVKSIPLTVSGKLNTVMVAHWIDNLQSDVYNLGTRLSMKDTDSVQATTSQETVLQVLCGEVLGIEASDVWLSKSFVQNGGDSLQAMQLLEKLRRRGSVVGLADLMRLTLAELAMGSASKTQFDEPETYVFDPKAVDRKKLAEVNVLPDEVDDIYPLSPVQQGMLLSQQQLPGTYSLSITCEVLSPDGSVVDRHRLRDAWKSVVRRHPVLRTIFIETDREDGLLDQLVLKTGTARIREMDSTDEETHREILNTYTRVDNQSQPPVEFIIFSAANGKVFCTINASHALVDGVSILLLFRDISKGYSGLLQKDSEIGYSPYIRYLQKLSEKDAIGYWSQYMDGCVPCHFPVFKENNSDLPLSHEINATIENVEDIHDFCKENNFTAATIFQAAWALVLAAYTGQDDVCFGYLTSGRDMPIPNINDAVGVYINMMICRLKLSQEKSAALLVSEAQNGFLSGLPFQHCSMAAIQHSLRASEPLFNTIMSLQSALGTEIWTTGSGERIGFEVVAEKDPTEYHVSVNLFVSRSRVVITFRYYADRLSTNMAQNILETFQRAIDVIISGPHTSVKALNVLSNRDKAQIEEWNSYHWQEVDECVHRMVHQQAVLHPHSSAIEAWDGKFTYSELDTITNHLANILLQNGVRPEALVPICFEKSRWTVVAQLAVLKAGGACVAFDPEHPQGRRVDLVKQCDATLALVSEGMKPLFEGLVKCVIAVGPNALASKFETVSSVPESMTPSNVAFVVFTSGSTGKPKGILLEHRAICSSAQAHGPVMNYGPEARVLQFASYTFDVSIGETFTCLMRGGTLCIPSDEERLNDLAGVINRMRANVVYLTPSVVRTLEPSDVPGVTTLALGGEMVRDENIAVWAQCAHLVNIYGPAECSVWSTALKGVPRDASSRNIGYGLGARMWIANPNDASELLPIGAEGELLIEGPILARGYLNDDIKTNLSFISAPAWLPVEETSQSRPARVYKTGDLARYNSDGSIHFIGRRDNQVKLHGQRIEMGEIEHTILAQQNIHDVLAFVPRAGPLNNKLVAVLSFTKSTLLPTPKTPSIELLQGESHESAQRQLLDIQGQVSAALPLYMVPSVWLAVKSIPVTKHGKSDRASVGAWLSEGLAINKLTTSQRIREPSSSIEIEIREAIASVLNLSCTQISMDQNFLALGGDSITAMQLSSRCRSRNLRIMVKDILRSSSIAQIAAQSTAIEDALSLKQDVKPAAELYSLPPAPTLDKLGINKEDIEDAYPCSPMQEGILISQSQAPETYKFHAVFAIRPRNSSIPVTVKRLQQAWARVVARHPSLRTIFIESPIQDRLYTQLVLKTHRPRFASAFDLDSLFRYPHDHPISHDSLVPAHRLTMSETEDGMYMNLEINHTLIDGSSMAIIIRDLAAAYDRELPPGPKYKDYVTALQMLSKGQTMQFWATQLNGVQPTFFPVLKDDSMVKELRSLRVPIEKHTRSSIEQFSRSKKFTMANIFQVVWAIVLRVYCGKSDVVFGYLSSGRDAEGVDAENSVGAFINMLVCRINVEDCVTSLAILQKAQDDFLNSLSYQHTSLAEIQHALQLSGDRLFNTILTLQRPFVEHQPTADQTVSIEYLGGSDPTEYDIGVDITLTEDMIDVSIHYWATLMSEPQASMLSSTFQKILSNIMMSPEVTIGSIDLLGDLHHQQILKWNNNGTVPESCESCIHDQVYEQSLHRPNATAIDAWDVALTYAELEILATKLAYRLSALGVGPNVVVPLCFDKSGWCIVSMLAVLKSGGAYTSMNPAHPIPHLASIINQTSARIILVGRTSYGDRFQGMVNHVILVESSLFASLSSPESVIAKQSSPSDTAMINFTSGSTGKPKGIVITHSGFCSMVASNTDMRFDQAARVFQFCTYTFDTSNSEIFFTLSLGKCVCVPSDRDRFNDLPGVMNRFAVDYAFLTPSIAVSISPDDVPTLKLLALVGEAASEDVAKTWRDRVVLINSYGPAECTVCSSLSILSRDVAATNIGQARGCIYWVTEPDDTERLAPVGCVGELLIEGPIVARGYLAPEATKLAFIHAPTWRKKLNPEARLYKTGDLVKYLPDGSLLYIGRKDSQIKLNGQRIEMGEIEKEIKGFDLVQHALVLLPKSGPCKNKLTAAVALKDFVPTVQAPARSEVSPLDAEKKGLATPQICIIREKMSEVLPDYMVPSIWLLIESMPLTVSGKTNVSVVSNWVSSLQSETYTAASAETTYELEDYPPGSIEGRLQLAVSRVLNIPISQVLLNRSFLSIGGDSITAMQLVVQCRAEGLKILFKDAMRSSTLASLSGLVEVSDNQIKNQAEEFDCIFDLTPIQQLYFEDISKGNSDPQVNQFNQSLLLRLSTQIPQEKIHSAIEYTVKRHSMLRARFKQSEGGQWVQLVPSSVSNSYRFNIHNVMAEREALDIALNAQKTLDICNGPVFAAELISIAENSSLLFLVAHHLVIDLVSWRIIVQDIEEFIDTGRPKAQSPFPFQRWQQLQSDYVGQLNPSSVLPYSVPPADYGFWGMSNNTNLRGDTAEISSSLSIEETDLLLTQCHQTMGTETLDILIAALLSSFYKTFGRAPPAIFNEGHGREPWTGDIDLTETVGWFTTIFPFYIPLKSNMDGLDIIRRVKDQRQQLPTNGWSYFSSRYLNPKAKESFKGHLPIEILFNYLGLYQGMERDNGLFQLQPFNQGDVGPAVRRYALFEINVYVVRRSAHISFVFHRDIKHSALIKDWIQVYVEDIRSMCEILHSTGERLPTLSDYRLSSMSYESLDNLRYHTLPQLKLSSKDIEDIYPCSPLQEGILLSQTRTKNAYAYFAIMKLESTDDSTVEAQKLALAWQQVVDRHAILRTTYFEKLTSRPFEQVVLRKWATKPMIFSFETAQAAVDWLSNLAKLNVPNSVPPHRLSIAETRHGPVYFKLEISHSLVDGATMAILVSELLEAYLGRLLTVGPLYREYIAYIQTQSADDSRLFWVDYLKDTRPCHFPPLLDSIKPHSELRHVEVAVPDIFDVRQFCQQNDVTLASIVRLAWSLVLSAYTGDAQICFGYLTAGREIPVTNIEHIAGPMINMLVSTMDVSLTGSKSVISELKRMQEEYLQALPHQHLGLAEIQHSLNLGGPLFNTVVSFQRRDIDNLVLGDLRLDYVCGEDPTEYDISINAVDSDKEWYISLSYLTERICPEQAVNIGVTLSKVLESLIASPLETIQSIEMLSSHHSEQINIWNSSPYPVVSNCLQTHVHRQAMLSPNSPAVESKDQILTYSGLERLTTQLGLVLRDLGIGPGDLVPVCFEKSTWAIVAMLGILKTGAGFVPLDPSHPPERLMSIINQISPPMLLTSENMSHTVTNLVQRNFIISNTSNIWTEHSTSTEDLSVSPENIAYVLFTSGSTGAPKGVVIQHAAASSSIIHHGQKIGCDSDTRMFQFAAYTFDACILEIFTTLAYGGCVCVPCEADRMSDLSGAINRFKANTIFLTPSVIHILNPEDVPTLRTVILGGEPLGPDNIESWAEKVQLMNGYGPTETCVFAVMNTFNSKTDNCKVLGHAVSCSTWISRLGNYNQLAPIGAVGELLIQGATLAQCYLNDEGRTLQSFITHPDFYPGNNSRFYRTGDLVRYSVDGSIIFIGRKDTQVKLRGQRIELSEIEHQARKILPPGYQSAVEICKPDGKENQTALAIFLCRPAISTSSELFASMDDDTSLLVEQLRKRLSETLPPYMQPTFYIPINWLPTTSAQKLDRKLLRDHVALLPESELRPYSLVNKLHRTPATPIEQRLQELWHQVLNIPLDRIGADDNFFQVGGDSIAAMKLAAASLNTIKLSVADILRYPILAELASVVDARTLEPEVQLRPFELLLQRDVTKAQVLKEFSLQNKISPDSVEDVYPCTPLQEGMITLSILSPGTYTLRKIFRLSPSVDVPQFKWSWEVVARECPILRTNFVQTACAGLLQVVMSESIAWRTPDNLQQYLQSDMEHAIGYGEPSVRYAITKDSHFVWTAHHAVYDGWSLPLIFDQVQAVYRQGYCPNVPRYTSFIKHLLDSDVESSCTFWKHQLDGDRPSTFPDVASAHYQPHVQGKFNYKVNLENSAVGTSILRGAWVLLLSSYTDSHDIVFGTTLSGRTSQVQGISKMIGPTITTVPVRAHVTPDLTVSEFINQLHQQNIDMAPHEQFGLHNIANLNSKCAAATEFQNLFVIQPNVEPEVFNEQSILEPVDIPASAIDKGFDTYPLIFECQIAGHGLVIEVRYDESVVSTARIRWMLRHYEHLLSQLLDKTLQQTSLAEIRIFNEHDQRQILEWNKRYPEIVKATVPEVFAEQVAQQPSAPAVDAWDGQLTYFELDRLSTLLAQNLVHVGVRPEMLVPLCFEKSKWAIVAQMAVIKAGGACVNLDPGHPLARLETIATTARATVLLVSPKHAGILRCSEDLQEIIVTMKIFHDLEFSNLPKNILPALSPKNAAYVLFTSGSTGKPKGIIIEHGSLCSSSKAHGSRWRIGPKTRVLQFAAYTFDVSCADIFTTLQRGGCICTPSEDDRLNSLSESINNFGCNWAFLTPTVASLLPAHNLPTLRTLVLGGEASTRDTIEKWHSVLDLIVCYGPAECTVYCSGAPPATGDSDPANLGAAIGALYWVANPHDYNKLTPLGCVGELLLEGPTIAREYFQDPVKTAHAFVQNPVWAPRKGPEERRRFYRTGDLVRYNEDGTIRFVSRKDTQIKVRGQRVELSEIEHAIRHAMPGLLHATVDAIYNSELQRQTVIAFLHWSNQNGKAEVFSMTSHLYEELLNLQRSLSQMLPSYMVPSMFIPMDRVPLTTNGKADRRQLRDFVASFSREQVLIFSLATTTKQEPTTKMEYQLRRLWAKVLKVEERDIGAGDHFFRLGGDSIIAMKLTALARVEDIHLPVQTIFKRPILSEIAADLENQLPQLQNTASPPYEPLSLVTKDVQPNFVSEIAGQIRSSPENIEDIVPATDFQASAIAQAMLKSKGMLNYLFLDREGALPWSLEHVEKAWVQFLQTHSILRTVFAVQMGKCYQVICKQLPQNFLSLDTKDDMYTFGKKFCLQDVDDERKFGDPLTKLIVISNPTCHRLILRVSHAQYDGVCLPLIWRTLSESFSGLQLVPEVPFSHFSHSMRQLCDAMKAKSYWRDLLAGSAMTNIVTHKQPDYRNTYDTRLTRKIPNLPSSSRSGITFATVLKTAWAIALSSLSDTNDVVFGHVTSGRNIPAVNIEKIVGPCINVVPVRVTVDSNETVHNLLRRVQEQHAESIAHESLGMQTIIRECSTWPKFTRYSSVVQHQNINEESAIKLDEYVYSMGDYCPPADEADIAIKSTPIGDEIEVLLLASSQSVGKGNATTLLHLLCDIIEMISTMSSDELRPSNWEIGQPLIPLPNPSPPTIQRVSNGSLEAIDQYFVRLVEQGWKEVLCDPRLVLQPDSDFFETGGGLVSIAMLAASWQCQGYTITVESLIDQPCVLDMARTLRTLA